MKKKTLMKLERKFLALPLHHIDSSIVLEPENTEDGRLCTKYFNLIGRKYRGKLCIPALGEILYDINEITDSSKQLDALITFTALIKERKIGFASVEGVEEHMTKIKQLDSRIEPMDRLNLACGISDNTDIFVTLDENLIHNEKLEKEFNIKIRHPKELI